MARQYRQRTLRTGADEVAHWDHMVAPFVGTQNNPRKKKVPAHMKQSRRGPPYVYPKTKSYPINDLFHARLALIYIMSPTNAPKRKRVIEAVAKRFPEYNWAAWWNKEIKKPKKDSSLKTWSYYLKGKVSRSRRGGWEQWDTATKHRNPRKTKKTSFLLLFLNKTTVLPSIFFIVSFAYLCLPIPSIHR